MSTQSQGIVGALVTPRSTSLHFSGGGIEAHHLWHSCLVRFSGVGIVPRQCVQASRSSGSSMRITSLAFVRPLQKHAGMSKVIRPLRIEWRCTGATETVRSGHERHNRSFNTDALRRPAASPLTGASRRSISR